MDDGSYFAPDEGCHRVDLQQTQVGSLPAARIGSVTVMLEGDQSDAFNTTKLSRLLRGIPAAFRKEVNASAFLLFEPFRAAAIDIQINQAAQPSGAPIIVFYDLPPEGRSTSSLNDASGKCHNLVAQQWPVGSRSAVDLCTSLEATIVALKADSLPEDTVFGDKSFTQDALPVEYSVANLGPNLGNGIYRMAGVGGALYSRTVQLNDKRHWIFHAVVSPVGTLMGGRIERNVAAESDSTASLKSETVYFDRDFQPIKYAIRESGQLDVLRHAAANWLEHHFSGAMARRIDTDGQNETLFAPLRAMVMEDAVDLRAAGLAQRLAMDAARVDRFVRYGTLSSPLFHWLDDPIEAAFQLTPDYSYAEGQHGTQVVSLLAADLPNLRVSLMSAGGGDWASRPRQAAEILIDKIRHDEPQVVNISKSYDDDLSDCDAVFGKVFKHFEDRVLFVIAAGNSEAHNASDVCPAGLARHYNNAVAVAGINDNGTLGPGSGEGYRGSNYGADTVQIAAKYCNYPVTRDQSGFSTHRQCGTSFSAPVVANAALRILARKPGTTPAVIKTTLMQSCQNLGLDVACGGPLSMEILESKSPQRTVKFRGTPAPGLDRVFHQSE